MDNLDFSLSEFAKHTLSWMVMTELLKLADGNNSVTVSFPGGGSYDCLTLRNDNSELVLLNRLGDNALANGGVVEDIWDRAARDPHEAALYIMSESELNATDEPTVSLETIAASAKIAKFLSLDRTETARAKWAVMHWDDTETLAMELGEFEIPEQWRNFEPATGCRTWASWVWILEINGKPGALLNLKNGEMVSPAHWERSLLGYETVLDEEGLPAVALAYRIEVVPYGTDNSWSTISRPSLARGLHRVLEEEEKEVELIPLRHITTDSELAEVWKPLRS